MLCKPFNDYELGLTGPAPLSAAGLVWHCPGGWLILLPRSGRCRQSTVCSSPLLAALAKQVQLHVPIHADVAEKQELILSSKCDYRLSRLSRLCSFFVNPCSSSLVSKELLKVKEGPFIFLFRTVFLTQRYLFSAPCEVIAFPGTFLVCAV